MLVSYAEVQTMTTSKIPLRNCIFKGSAAETKATCSPSPCPCACHFGGVREGCQSSGDEHPQQALAEEERSGNALA